MTSEYLSSVESSKYINRKESPRNLPFSNPKTKYRSPGPEEDLDPKYQYLRKWYETRVKSLSDDIKNAFVLIQKDMLIDTMKQDAASGEYINQRVREIIDDCISNDREVLLEKMALQCSYLKNEFSNSEHEHMKIVDNLNSHLESLQEQCRKEAQTRERFEIEAKDLRIGMRDLKDKYEEALNGKDEEIRRRNELEYDLTREFENKLKESEEKYKELSQKYTAIQKEWDIEKSRAKEQEIDLNRTQGKVKEATKIIDDYEKFENELKETINSLREENVELKTNLTKMATQKKEMENSFKKSKEETATEHDNNIQKLQKAYKEKIEDYKRKVRDYKERLVNKENENNELRGRFDEDRNKKQRNIDFLESKVQEQRAYYEEMIRALEDENSRRISEMASRHDKELKEVQTQFKKMLDDKIVQIQEDSDQQIEEIKKKEREVQGILDEKTMEIERDYIPLDHHERVVEEKNALLQTLKEDMTAKDFEHQQEVISKLRDLEGRLNKEHDSKLKAIKAIINEHEQQIHDLSSKNRGLEQESRLLREERKALSDSVQQLEVQKRKLHESVEEWVAKYKKLKVGFDEEQTRKVELEKELKTYQENCRTVTEQLEETSKEAEERKNELDHLSQEATNLEITLKDSNKERKRLDKELDELNRNFLEAKETIRKLQEENELLQEENRAIGEKTKEIIKEDAEQFEKERNEHWRTKTKLREAEEKINQLENEIEENKDQIEELRRLVDRIDRQNKQSLELNETDKERIEELEKEKRALEKRVNQTLIRVSTFRRMIIEKLDVMRTELVDLKHASSTYIRSLMREYELKFSEVLDKVDLVLGKKEVKHREDKEALREKLHREFNMNHEVLKSEYEEKYSELQENNEMRHQEKQRQIEYKDEAIKKLTEKLNEVTKIVERNELKQSQLEIELFQARKEKEEAGLNLEQTKQKYIREIENMREDSTKAIEGLTKEKRGIEEKYSTEINNLNKEIEKHIEDLKEYEEKLKKLMTETEESRNKTNKEFEETQRQFEISLKISQGTEEMLVSKVTKLENRIAQLKQSELDLQNENKEIRESYEKKIEVFETQLNEVNRVTEEEREAMCKFRDEKINEMNQYLNTISLLQEEIKAKNDKIKKLIDDRDRIEQYMRDLQVEVETRTEELASERSELLNRTKAQSKEIDQLHLLLSKSHRSREETHRRREGKALEDLSAYRNVNNKFKRDLSRTERGGEHYKTHDPSKMQSDKEKARTISNNMSDQNYYSTKESNSTRRKI